MAIGIGHFGTIFLIQPTTIFVTIIFISPVIISIQDVVEIAFAQILFQQWQITACLQTTMCNEGMLTVLAIFILNERNVIIVLLQHVLGNLKTLVGLDTGFLGKGNGTINPIVSFVIAALTQTKTVGVNQFLELIILQPEPIECVFYAYAPDVNQIDSQADPAACMLAADYDVALAHVFNVITHIARSYLQGPCLLLDILFRREKLLALLLLLFLLCHLF